MKKNVLAIVTILFLVVLTTSAFAQSAAPGDQTQPGPGYGTGPGGGYGLWDGTGDDGAGLGRRLWNGAGDDGTRIWTRIRLRDGTRYDGQFRPRLRHGFWHDVRLRYEI